MGSLRLFVRGKLEFSHIEQAGGILGYVGVSTNS